MLLGLLGYRLVKELPELVVSLEPGVDLDKVRLQRGRGQGRGDEHDFLLGLLSLTLDLRPRPSPGLGFGRRFVRRFGRPHGPPVPRDRRLGQTLEVALPALAHA